MHMKFERLLWKSLTTLEVMTYYFVVHTGPVVKVSVSRAADPGSIPAVAVSNFPGRVIPVT